MREPPPPQPPSQPPPTPSTFLRDISNYKTPKPSIQNHNPNNPPSPLPLFLTASKQTPFSSSSSTSSAFRRRPSVLPSASKSKATRRLKAFELEQSKSSRKAQIRREKTIRTLSKSLTAWLNFLFENPKSCGCDVAAWDEEARSESVVNGKRDSLQGRGIGIDSPWRSPKRQRNCSWWAAAPAGDVESSSLSGAASAGFPLLEVSLQDVCSFEDLKERMEMCLSVKCRNEVLSMMNQVAKNIDDGRLRMKAHCPLVTDVGLKEKATRILMCYNTIWLRIGLHIVFGGDSLLPTEDGNSDQDDLFLKMIIDKQFFSHAGLAKCYAYNKMVEGLYRPGYFEALGNVILKRFLLLVLVLDKAKCQSTLPVNYGVDGIDGGSPLLFSCRSHIKSSRQMIHEFLSPVMHGEGDLLAHLVIVGYKVSYQQSPLVEYEFGITDLFEDFQDGVRLCRTVQLLEHDASILTKVVVPSDTRKKNLLNCSVAMQYLKQAGMPLSDEDGVVIVAEDVANGDKELTLSLVWNIFVYLQLPLLINKTLLAEEICKVKRSNMDLSMSKAGAHLEMLLEWIQAICKNYDLKAENFASLVDGKALCYMLDYYFRNQLHGYSSLREAQDTSDEESILSKSDNTVVLHNFILVQRVTTMLGNFPEVLQMSDILENDPSCNERSVIILLIFLSSQLIGRRNMDQLNIQKLMGWKDHNPDVKPNMDQLNIHKPMGWNHRSLYANSPKNFQPLLCIENAERAAKVIQSHFRGSTERHNYRKIKTATSFLQSVVRAWLTVTRKKSLNGFGKIFVRQIFSENQKSSEIFERYLKFMIERRSFLRVQKSVLLIQQATRTWIKQRQQEDGALLPKSKASADLTAAATIVQSYIRGTIERSKYVRLVAELHKGEAISKELEIFKRCSKAAVDIQLAWRKFTERKFLSYQCLAAIKIQRNWRGWLVRRDFWYKREAAIKLQSALRCLNCSKAFTQHRLAAIEIQQFARGQIAQNRIIGSCLRSRRSCSGSSGHTRSSYIHNPEFEILSHSVLKLQRWWKRVLFLKSRTSSAIVIQSHMRGWVARREADSKRHNIVVIQKSFAAIKIQSHWRCWLMRRDFLCQREAIIKIQCGFRFLKCFKTFQRYRLAAVEIQRFIRGHIARSRLLGASSLCSGIHRAHLIQIRWSSIQSLEMKILLCSVVKLQRWWKRVLVLMSRKKSAVIIQSHIRGWIARRKASRARRRIVVVQSYWKGYLARKGSREQLLHLRQRVQRSATNVDNSMRLMNRLVAALSQLLSDRVSNILHTCATLDMATEHSEKCCETLVAAGAINALLNQIQAANRSAPCQEVRKHALSTLRNLGRYPHLTEVLINTHGSVEIIFLELLRNKEEGYFIAADLLKKLCTRQEGIEAICKLPAFLKRLSNLAEDLERKANLEKRNPRLAAARENTERRLREAGELLQLVMNG
ncbi:uncharacterized protein LOC131239954 isoform X2 [Magnolia sinica]|uniref:uncharacterized protein LOC131239954 isoform X2 n=1 Tax=Magnolia sinica TaxID=86752 RepID=UPI00265933F5|nr:uncharacterized protein LOC131239954 isoform X2 [Magnolia sinica]